jgi:hypothetical protein
VGVVRIIDLHGTYVPVPWENVMDSTPDPVGPAAGWVRHPAANDLERDGPAEGLQLRGLVDRPHVALTEEAQAGCQHGDRLVQEPLKRAGSAGPHDHDASHQSVGR